MQLSTKEVVIKIIQELKPESVLDVPAGDGWLADALNESAVIDGIDLYKDPGANYRRWEKANLDDGIPEGLGPYHCIVSCEGLEHFGNPELFFRTAHARLMNGGTLLVTTPNVWFPQSRLQYLLRGFFPSFPSLAGQIRRGDHMHLIPWSFPQVHLFLTLNGFTRIQLHQQPLSQPKHFHEKLFGWPQALYCRKKVARSQSAEEKKFWEAAGSMESIYGRNLIVTAVKE